MPRDLRNSGVRDGAVPGYSLNAGGESMEKEKITGLNPGERKKRKREGLIIVLLVLLIAVLTLSLIHI